MTMLEIASVVLLGTLSGALLTEGAVLVPYWRSLDASEFARMHHDFAPRLYKFFAPLTVIAVTLTVASGVVHAWADDGGGLWPSLGAGVAALSLLLFYGAYFKAANARLPATAVKDDQAELQLELRRWHRVHHCRTAICVIAFVLATIAINPP